MGFHRHFDEFHEKQASELRSQWKLPIEQQKVIMNVHILCGVIVHSSLFNSHYTL